MALLLTLKVGNLFSHPLTLVLRVLYYSKHRKQFSSTPQIFCLKVILFFHSHSRQLFRIPLTPIIMGSIISIDYECNSISYFRLLPILGYCFSLLLVLRQFNVRFMILVLSINTCTIFILIVSRHI